MKIQKQIEELEGQLAALRAEQAEEQSSKRQEGLRKLSEVSENLAQAMKRGQEIAEEYGIMWSPDLPYGMGGDYYPKTMESNYYGQGWQSSSANC